MGGGQIHPNLIQQWKKKLQESASDVFLTNAERRAEQKHYTYLLWKMKIERPNQVWSTDITYTADDGCRASVIGIVDWFSRKLMAYNVVNTMDVYPLLSGENSVDKILHKDKPEAADASKMSSCNSRRTSFLRLFQNDAPV